MRWSLTLVLMALIIVPALPGAAGDDEGPQPWLQLSGFYAFNGYSQNNFFLGKGAVGGVSDKDEYAIQLLRLQAEIGWGEHLKAVIRGDLAQGIWGIDNSQRENDRSGFSNLFNNKDTNFVTHIDWAYIDYTNPDWGLNAKLGRQKMKLGNLLVLDQDSDGLLLTKNVGESGKDKLGFGWAKMSEGADSLTDEDVSADGGLDGEDATLFLVSYTKKVGDWTINPFLAYYIDEGDDDGATYIPQGLDYFRARFTPQISEAQALGLSIAGTAGGWSIKGELDYLQGEDDIANIDSGPRQLVDVNNGDLEGYNLYLNATRKMGPGKLGVVLGLGSGDDDVMSGKGNINRIRTNGFFYITEVWEDSVMPDELGITPQGLGSPASRGYRELENTTLLQLNYTYPINDRFTYFISGTWLKATEELFPWSDSNGDGAIQPEEMGTEGDDELGQELDMKLTWKLSPKLAWIFRGGIFFPGDAAGYLINGTNAFDDDAWELRTTVKFTFGALRIGG